MLIEFEHQFDCAVDHAYAFFRTPRDWPKLFGAFGEVEDRGEGWYAVPLRRFPFPLVAKITRDEPLRLVEWELRGFWQGRGQVTFTPIDRGVVIRGYERISPKALGFLAPLVEPFLEKRFHRVWESGWRRLRREAANRATPEDEAGGAIP